MRVTINIGLLLILLLLASAPLAEGQEFSVMFYNV